jgi:hypothetical protein
MKVDNMIAVLCSTENGEIFNLDTGRTSKKNMLVGEGTLKYETHPTDWEGAFRFIQNEKRFFSKE